VILLRRLWSRLVRLAGNATVALTVAVAVAVVGFITLEAAIEDEIARDCVGAWERTDEFRESLPEVIEALVDTFPNADPEVVETARTALARRLEATIVDPPCDRADAQARLDK
jgi:hypothetical protein